MKIIGSKDYYDGAGFGVDPSIIFVRGSNTLDVPSEMIAHVDYLGNIFHNHELLELFPSSMSVADKNPAIEFFTVVVAGEATVGARLYENPVSPVYDQEIFKLLDQNRPFWFNQRFALSDHDRNVIREWAIENKVVTAVTRVETTHRKDKGFVKINGAFLKDYEFYRVLNSPKTHMAISNWIGGVLPSSGNPVITLSDVSKIKKAGFDTKVSFRKAKEHGRT